MCFFCLCASIEHVRQSDFQNLYSVTCERFSLIWVNQTRLIYRYRFCLSVVCLHAQELYTHKPVARSFLFKPAKCCTIHHCPKSLANQQLLWMRCKFIPCPVQEKQPTNNSYTFIPVRSKASRKVEGNRMIAKLLKLLYWCHFLSQSMPAKNQIYFTCLWQRGIWLTQMGSTLGGVVALAKICLMELVAKAKFTVVVEIISNGSHTTPRCLILR